MRVRLIRPAYWTDADLHTRLSADCREFYIGLWMEADDAGFVAWDIDRIGADLYPYRSPSSRRARLCRWLEELSVNGHARLLECGAHVLVPNLTKYQKPPKPSYQHKVAHETCLRHMAPPGASGDHGVPAQGFSKGLGVSKGREGVIEGVRRGANGLTQEEATSDLGGAVALAAARAQA